MDESPTDLIDAPDDEWRELIRPLFFKMYAEGIHRATITRDGAMVRAMLDGHATDANEAVGPSPLPTTPSVDSEHISRERLVFALRETHKLLHFYAGLLNMHDGGGRIVPVKVEHWLARVEANTDGQGR